jgi:hypothetical protein
MGCSQQSGFDCNFLADKQKRSPAVFTHVTNVGVCCVYCCRFLLCFLMVGVLALYQMGSAVLVGQHELSSNGKVAMVAGAAGSTRCVVALCLNNAARLPGHMLMPAGRVTAGLLGCGAEAGAADACPQACWCCWLWLLRCRCGVAAGEQSTDMLT